MQFSVPTKLHDWLNVEVYSWVRRIDVFLFIAGVACVLWYGYTGGWRGAVLGAVAFVLFMWVGMFFRDTSGG